MALGLCVFLHRNHLTFQIPRGSQRAVESFQSQRIIAPRPLRTCLNECRHAKQQRLRPNSQKLIIATCADGRPIVKCNATQNAEDFESGKVCPYRGIFKFEIDSLLTFMLCLKILMGQSVLAALQENEPQQSRPLVALRNPKFWVMVSLFFLMSFVNTILDR